MTYTEQMKEILKKVGGNTDSNLYSDILLAILDALSTSGGSGSTTSGLSEGDISTLKKIIAATYEEEYTIVDDSGASPAFEQISGQISSIAATLQEHSQILERVPNSTHSVAMVIVGMSGVNVSDIPIWDESGTYTLRSGVWRMWGSGKTVTTDIEFDVGGGLYGTHEVVVESLDSSTKSLNAMVCNNGKFKFSNEIALGTTGVMIYVIED